MSFNIRLEELVNYLDENPTSFAKGLKTASVETIRKLIKNEKANPTLNTIIEILEKYPQISAEWFIRGKGEIEVCTSYSPKQTLNKVQNGKNGSYSDTDLNKIKDTFNGILDEFFRLRKENKELRSQIGGND